MKSIRISDETYKKVAHIAKKEKRTITGTLDLLVEAALRMKAITVDTATLQEMTSEPAPHYAVDDYERGYEMTDEELRQMQQSKTD